MCNPLDPTCLPGAIAEAAADSVLQMFVEQLSEGINMTLKTMATSWFNVPSPNLAGSGIVPALAGDLSTITALLAIASFLVGLAKVAIDMRASSGIPIVRMLVNLVAVNAIGATSVGLLLVAGDQFSPWIVSRAAGEPFRTELLSGMIKLTSLQSNLAMGLIIGFFLLCAAIAQTLFMIVRGAMIIVLVVLLPPIAAGTATEEGMHRFKRLFALLLGAVLYKPVAAIIFGVGIREMHGQSQGAWLMEVLYGFVTLMLAVLALPALIKFLMPAAAAGSSPLFSGGAVAAAGIATGAAVVKLAAAPVIAGATGGAGAGAVGASGAGATAPAAGGAASSGGAAASRPFNWTPTPGRASAAAAGAQQAEPYEPPPSSPSSSATT